jgi:hypothetical protein
MVLYRQMVYRMVPYLLHIWFAHVCPIGSSNGSSTGAAAVGVAAGVGIFKVYFYLRLL